MVEWELPKLLIGVRFPSPACFIGGLGNRSVVFSLSLFFIGILTSCTTPIGNKSFRQEKFENFIWPAAGKVISIFGTRYEGSINRGIDLQTEDNAPIYAAESGWVSFVHDSPAGLGKTIVLDHGQDYSTVYARMGEIIVQQGEKVTQGQLIARVGNGGLTRSPTLHFEIRKSQKPENPFYYFSE